MDSFQNIIIIYYGSINIWYASTNILQKDSIDIYNSLSPSIIHMNDSMNDLRAARTNALLLPPRGFLWYSNVFNIHPIHSSIYVYSFVVSLLRWLKRYKVWGDNKTEKKIIQTLKRVAEKHPVGILDEKPSHFPTHYAIMMENNPPGRIRSTDDMTEEVIIFLVIF